MKINKVFAIAVDEYSDKNLDTLVNCQSDLNQILKILNEKYKFDDTKFLFGKDQTTKQNVYLNLTELLINATTDENILLIYAGHGIYHEKLKQTYWQLSDSVYSDPSSWLNISEILSFIEASDAFHISIISDSCFSGALFENLRGGGLTAYKNKKSREALTSGGMEKVTDGKKGELSPFAKTIISVLDDNISTDLSFSSFSLKACELFDSNRKQTPQFGRLSGVGDAGGSFIFELKQIDLPIKKGLEGKDLLLEKMGNLFIELPNKMLECVEELKNVTAKKNEVVKGQKYDEAAQLRDIEKKILVNLSNMGSDYINDLQENYKKKIDLKELENNKKLDADVDSYIKERKKLMEAFTKWEIKIGGKEVENIPILASSLPILSEGDDPVIGLFYSKRSELVQNFEKNILFLYEYLCILKGASENVLFTKYMDNLKDILAEIIAYEIDLLRNYSNDYIKVSLRKKELEVKLLAWISGQFTRRKGKAFLQFPYD